MAEASTTRVMRSYTRGLRIPVRIGRLYDGMRIPGGPYTISQFAVAAVVLVVGYLLMPLWSSLLPDMSVISSQMLAWPALPAFAWLTAWLAGFIPDGINPVHAAVGVAGGVRPSRFGRVANRAVATLPSPRRHQARFRVDGQWVRPLQVPSLEDASAALVGPELAEPVDSTPVVAPTPTSPATPVVRPTLASFRAAIVKE